MDEMISKFRYWWYHYKIKYSFVLIIIIAILDILISRKLLAMYLKSFGSPFQQTSSPPVYPIHLIAVMLSLVVIIFPVMVVRYKDETGGRNCFKDMRGTGRSYGELLAYYKDADPYRLSLSEFPIGNWKNVEGVILGKVGQRVICRSAFEKGGEGSNYALYALPGAGKTTCQIIPTALRYGGSVLAIDIKGDIYKVTKGKRRIKVFAPDDPKNSCHYDPLSGIKLLSPMERRTYLEQMAAVIVPEDKENKYWHETARAYFVGIALYCIEWNILTLPDIAQEILQGNGVDWVMTIKDSNCSEAQTYTNSMYGSSEKNLSGAYAELAKCVRPFASGNLAELLTNEGGVLSPKSLNAGYDIYIEIPQDKISVYAPITTILLQDFMTFFMRRPDKSSGEKQCPVLFLLDEFPQLQFDYQFLSTALATLRSKGISIFLCQQSTAQLSSAYGDKGFQTIMDCCQTISIMSMQDPSSRKWAQELVGSRKVLKISTSTGGGNGGPFEQNHSGSYGRSTQETREPIFEPEDFGNLGTNVLIYIGGKYVLAEKTPWYE